MSDAAWQEEIERLEEETRIVFLTADINRLRQLWAEDLFVNSPLNRIHNRSQVLDLLERGVIRHASLDQWIELITRHADVVVVMGHDGGQATPVGQSSVPAE